VLPFVVSKLFLAHHSIFAVFFIKVRIEIRNNHGRYSVAWCGEVLHNARPQIGEGRENAFKGRHLLTDEV
jgi:hypothetical protein